MVAGYIEPHARPKTAALLHGLEVLPSKSVPYNGITLREFDIDAALQKFISYKIILTQKFTPLIITLV